MEDKDGLYYYPFPENKRVRMYVRLRKGVICFRLWNQDDPNLWQEHGWVPHDAIVKASSQYRNKPFDPRAAYDIRLAKALLDEKELKVDG
jgi:hypothetical protein